MKKVAALISLGVFLSFALFSSAFCASGGGYGGGGHYGGHFGGGWGGPYWGWYGFGPWSGYPYAYPYYAPYYSYPYPYAYPQAPYPPADTQLAVPSEPQQFYWYYCQNPQGYYPFVKSCPGGWMQVIPTPPQSEGVGAAP